MGWWDWATTGREDIQTAGGKAVGGAKGYLTSPAGVIGGVAGPIAGLPADVIQGLDWLRNRGGGGGGGGQAAATPQAGPTPATPTSTQTAPPTAAAEPTAAGPGQFSPLINPLVAQSFYAGVIQPMMQGIAKQYGDQSAQWQNQLQNQMMQMPPQFRAQFGKQQTQMAQDQSNVMAALMNSAIAAPQWQQTQDTLSGIQKTVMQDYAKTLANQQLNNLGISFKPDGTIDTANSPALQSPTK